MSLELPTWAKQVSQLFLVGIVLAISGCATTDDPTRVNEQELITTVIVTFGNVNDGSDITVATYQDPDGPGGSDPIITHARLRANAEYIVQVDFLNESGTPTIDISQEVAEEDDEHQVFLQPSAGLNFTYTYNDQDDSGFPIGLMGRAVTGAANTGTLNFILVHQPVKDAEGVSIGNLANAGGKEDISVIFDVAIQ